MKPSFLMFFLLFVTTCFSQTKTHDEGKDNEPLLYVEVMPEFPGKEKAMYKFLYDKIEYPAKCREANIQGKVIVQFVIDTSGAVSNVKVLRSPDSLFSAEVVRVVSLLPNFIPGMQNGKKQFVYYQLPVIFKLNDEETVSNKIPEYPGGDLALYEFIRSNLKYPGAAAKKNVKGNVLVKAIIGTDGKVTDAEIINGLQDDCDKEALRTVKLLKGFKPAMKNGVVAEGVYYITVTFGPDKK